MENLIINKDLNKIFEASELIIEGHKATCSLENEDYSFNASLDIPNDMFSVEVWVEEDKITLTEKQKNSIALMIEKYITEENGSYSSFCSEFMNEGYREEMKLERLA